MILEAELVCRIEAENTYSFREILDAHSLISAESSGEQKLLNTLELFAYGGCPAYSKYKTHFVTLSEKGERKLVVLTILAVLNNNVGNKVHFDEILPVIYPLVVDLCALEAVLISMVDAQLVSVKMDQETKLLRVIDTYVLRDAYNEKTYKLRILKEDDLMALSVGSAREILQKWLEESIVPARQELDE